MFVCLLSVGMTLSKVSYKVYPTKLQTLIYGDFRNIEEPCVKGPS